MGKGGNQGEGSTELQAPMPTFRWEEIQKHNLRTDRWLVIDRKVYNVTKWSQRHPGGTVSSDTIREKMLRMPSVPSTWTWISWASS